MPIRVVPNRGRNDRARCCVTKFAHFWCELVLRCDGSLATLLLMTYRDPASARSDATLAARAVECTGPPEWRPLLEIAGEHSQDFMWMSRLTLEDGTRVEAYKHRQTRRYLQLTLDGDAYSHLSDAHPHDPLAAPDRYRPTSRHAALEFVFRDWHLLNEGASDREEMTRELERVLAIAKAGGRATYDPEWLARQRRFEAAVAKATAFETATDPRYRGGSLTLPGEDFVGDLEELEAPRYGGPLQ